MRAKPLVALALCLGLGAGCDPSDKVIDSAPVEPLPDPADVDEDADGYTDTEDCDDLDPAVNPGAEEEPYDGVDNDCDPDTLDDDLDTDGHDVEVDCDDADPAAHPDAPELCDGIDNDCDGQVDEEASDAITFYADADGDGFGDPEQPLQGCELVSGASLDNTDCDDTRADVHPEMEEICNDGVDNNCDGDVNHCALPVELGVDECYAKITGEGSMDHAGWGFNAVGDLDGDGAPDLAIGSAGFSGDWSDWSTFNPSHGNLHIVSGTVQGEYSLTNPPGDSGSLVLARVEREQDFSLFGFFVSSEGDLNGDGHNDVAVGAPYFLDPTYNAILMGKTYVYPGPFNGDGLTGELSAVDDALLTVEGLPGTYTSGGSLYAIHDFVGMSFDMSGDFNDDGYDDLLINSAWMVREEDDGNAFLFYGPIPSQEHLTVADADVTFTNAPDTTAANTGIPRVAHIGDVNGDGIGDIGIGNQVSEDSGFQTGAFYVFFGPPTGDIMDTADADAVIYGGYDEEWFGAVFGEPSSGDFNNDGYDDLLIGSHGTHAAGAEAGATYLFHGPFSGTLTTADADAWWPGEAAGDELGDIANAGDLNGDGYLDILLGADHADVNGEDSGAAYLFFGPFAGEYAPSDAHVVFQGEAAGDRLGWYMFGLGDLNGDGVDDIALTAPYEDAGGEDAGAVYTCVGIGI